MDWIAIFLRYYAFTITLFAFYVNYAHSAKPVVLDVQLGTCYTLDWMQENTDYEQLGLEETDIINICRIGDSPDTFGLVITKDGSLTSECHQFNKRYVKFTFLKRADKTAEIFVFGVGEGVIRWNLKFAAKTRDMIRNIYFNLVSSLKSIAEANDLQKRDNSESNFDEIAWKPLILVDDVYEHWNVIHIMNTSVNEQGPVLAFFKGKITVFTPERNIVYMRWNDFPNEEYFFTCSNSQIAGILSDTLSQYSEQGRAIDRST